MGLENIIGVETKKMRTKRTMVISDLHIPFIDNGAFDVTMSYANNYKPNNLIINGDLVDFYSLSFWSKSPDRKYDVINEIKLARQYLTKIRESVGDKCDIIFIKGNHEQRLQRYLSKNAPELYELEELDISNLLQFKKNKIKYVDASDEYWNNDNGHVMIGDMLITHGDSRMNGASYSKYSCYGIKNTILNGIQNNVIQGHSHRLGKFYHSSINKDYIGLESGCLCIPTGTANWQQGFNTFETYKGKTVNPRVHQIFKDLKETYLLVDSKKYSSKKQNKQFKDIGK